MTGHPALPAILAPHAAAIEATRLPIIAAVIAGVAPVDFTTSRVGGMPWWPADRPYPTDRDGRPLVLLAQVNCAEMPTLDPFPRSGLLQIFIGTDDLYGCNFDEPRNCPGFHVAYHLSVESRSLDRHPLADTPLLPTDSPLEHPLIARTLKFELASMTIDPGDYRFEALLPDIAASDVLTQAYLDAQSAPAIRLGGYPSFTQQDPRSYRGAADIGDFTLLTVASTDGIMWGDVGIGQFFVHANDLAVRDFSKVAYNWDCS